MSAHVAPTDDIHIDWLDQHEHADDGDAWAEASWREVAKQYHRDRAGRVLSVVTEPTRLAQLRRLMADDVSLERAWHELNNTRSRPTPAATVEALMFSLRRGAQELLQSDTQRRLSVLDEDQLEAVCDRVQNFKPEIAKPWSDEDAGLLVSVWRGCRG
jgi:hypothetical protein